jgi:hypothetical protein
VTPGGRTGRPAFSCFPSSWPEISKLGPPTLRVNPRFWFQPGPSIPLDLLSRVGRRDRFLSGYPLAWVGYGPAQVLTPFWIPRAWFSSFQLFRRGEAPPSLDKRVCEALLEAGILVDAECFDAALAAAPDLLARARQRLGEHGYVNVGNALHPLQIRALGAYYRQIAEASGSLGDSQCAGRFGMHNESLSQFVHRQLLPLMQALTNELIIPSYSYFAAYRPRAVLGRHTDREQCELTMSLLVRYEPERKGVAAWPLYIETAAGPIAIHQRIGDAFVFQGRVLPHWRPELPEGHVSDSLLLHFVPHDFTGSLS